MAWALWLDDEHRAAKLHLVFDVIKWAPVKATLTHGNASEKQELRRMLESGRLYVIDRGYAQYSFFQEIIDAGSSFIGRIRDNAEWELIEQRELFFRWFKCVLGCRHLLSESQQGVEIQAYVALIASLLISIWTGRKPTKRTYEMICFYFMGLAALEELQAHIARLQKHKQD